MKYRLSPIHIRETILRYKRVQKEKRWMKRRAEHDALDAGTNPPPDDVQEEDEDEGRNE
jgi:hypothetical protein